MSEAQPCVEMMVATMPATLLRPSNSSLRYLECRCLKQCHLITAQRSTLQRAFFGSRSNPGQKGPLHHEQLRAPNNDSLIPMVSPDTRITWNHPSFPAKHTVLLPTPLPHKWLQSTRGCCKKLHPKFPATQISRVPGLSCDNFSVLF